MAANAPSPTVTRKPGMRARRWLPVILSAAFLAVGCRSSDLVESELRARDTELRGQKLEEGDKVARVAPLVTEGEDIEAQQKE